jgi:competence ComEA-like helix-hairpin-helix protein
MPTPAEQKALAFVSAVILLGAGARIVSGGPLSRPGPTVAEQQGLARQAAAAESSADHSSSSKRTKTSKKAPKRRYTGAKFDSTGLLIEGTGVVSTTGFPPPGPRVDLDMRAEPIASRASGRPVPAASRSGAPAAPIDLDVASAAEIERLPGVGPALAARIVASRDSVGPFGGLAALGRVKGVGPATLERLARLVTFSGQARR